MNRKLIVSILAIILVITMILSIVLAALPAAYGYTGLVGVYDKVEAVVPVLTGIAA